MTGRGISTRTRTRRAARFAAALLGSLAVHGIAVAAVVALGRTKPAEPLPMIAVEIVAEAPPGVGASHQTKGAARPTPGSLRAASPPRASKPETREAQIDPPPKLEPAQPARPPVSEAATRPREFAALPAQPAVPPPRPKPRLAPRAVPKPPISKPAISKPALRKTAEAARRKIEAPPHRTASPTSQAALPAGAAAAYSPPRVGGGGAGNPLPKYPEGARERGVEGRVVLRVRVGADGRALGVTVSRSSGADELDRAAAEAVRRWRFEPARQGGLAVAGSVTVPIRFRLVEN
jgi:protein TonB